MCVVDGQEFPLTTHCNGSIVAPAHLGQLSFNVHRHCAPDKGDVVGGRFGNGADSIPGDKHSERGSWETVQCATNYQNQNEINALKMKHISYLLCH